MEDDCDNVGLIEKSIVTSNLDDMTVEVIQFYVEAWDDWIDMDEALRKTKIKPASVCYRLKPRRRVALTISKGNSATSNIAVSFQSTL